MRPAQPRRTLARTSSRLPIPTYLQPQEYHPLGGMRRDPPRSRRSRPPPVCSRSRSRACRAPRTRSRSRFRASRLAPARSRSASIRSGSPPTRSGPYPEPLDRVPLALGSRSPASRPLLLAREGDREPLDRLLLALDADREALGRLLFALEPNPRAGPLEIATPARPVWRMGSDAAGEDHSRCCSPSVRLHMAPLL